MFEIPPWYILMDFHVQSISYLEMTAVGLSEN